MVDYKLLLIKYINYIGEMEGITYIDEHISKDFTKEEEKELNQLDKEAYELYNK